MFSLFEIRLSKVFFAEIDGIFLSNLTSECIKSKDFRWKNSANSLSGIAQFKKSLSHPKLTVFSVNITKWTCPFGKRIKFLCTFYMSYCTNWVEIIFEGGLVIFMYIPFYKISRTCWSWNNMRQKYEGMGLNGFIHKELEEIYSRKRKKS